METIDLVVIAIYLTGIVAAGFVFSRRMKDSRQVFTAGGQSPWWVSGLSGFMTMFSAGTFVVWGGIAYEYGAVAIVINLGYGIAAMLAGTFVAGRWRKLGVDSAAEFLQLRYGESIVQFYTWFKGTVGLFVMGGSIYAFSKIACSLIPLPDDLLLADASTGHLSIPLTSIALSLLVIAITFAGGLWAVLVTDVLPLLIIERGDDHRDLNGSGRDEWTFRYCRDWLRFATHLRGGIRLGCHMGSIRDASLADWSSNEVLVAVVFIERRVRRCGVSLDLGTDRGSYCRAGSFRCTATALGTLDVR